jgi:hypothetical protein
MTDLEISKALALAIGWGEEQLQIGTTRLGAKVLLAKPKEEADNRIFDYRDWNVIGPIAEEQDLFPYLSGVGWIVSWAQGGAYDTPQKAIAMAVIGAKT